VAASLPTTGAEAADVSVFSFVEFALWDAQDDATNFQRNYSTGEVEVADGVIYHKTEYRERRDHFAYFACSAPVTGCMVTFNMSRSASSYESGISRGMGFRDCCQDLLGSVQLAPARARQRIRDLAATQFASGGAFHQYQPLTKTTENMPGGVAESVFIAGLFTLAARELAAIAELAGRPADHSNFLADAEKMATTVAEHGWDGDWFLRAYDFGASGEIGRYVRVRVLPWRAGVLYPAKCGAADPHRRSWWRVRCLRRAAARGRTEHAGETGAPGEPVLRRPGWAGPRRLG
jgi:cellobiose phosphorylase